jgi:hypothetical protein
MKKYFILGYFFGCFLFFLTSEQNLNLAKVEKFDLRLLKNEIVALNLSANKNIFANTYESSIYDVAEVAVKKEKSIPISIDIKTKTKQGKNSIFVEAFQVIRTFPTRPNLNYYDPVENQFVKQSVMLKAHLTCIKQVQNLPREIDKKDKKVKFDKKYSGLFKKNQNYEKVFGYNLYLEENLGKDSSKNKIKQGEQKLFKKYEETSKKYLRENLFENPCIIKSEKCTYLDTDNLVTIYYDEFTDLFAIVDLKENCLLDFDIATEVKYAEIFAYKSSGTLKAREICLSPNEQLVKNFEGSKELEVYQEKYILSYDDAIAVLESRYGPIDALNFITVENGEFKIQEEQAAKKLEHAVCFAINPADYDFSQDQAKEINVKGGIVAYVRKGKTLPNLDLIRAYQNAIKNFCEDRTQSDRNNKSTFRGDPSITFFNEKSRQAVIFNRETKVFITAYKISDDQRDRYIESGEIGQ